MNKKSLLVPAAMFAAGVSLNRLRRLGGVEVGVSHHNRSFFAYVISPHGQRKEFLAMTLDQHITPEELHAGDETLLEILTGIENLGRGDQAAQLRLLKQSITKLDPNSAALARFVAYLLDNLDEEDFNDLAEVGIDVPALKALGMPLMKLMAVIEGVLRTDEAKQDNLLQHIVSILNSDQARTGAIDFGINSVMSPLGLSPDSSTLSDSEAKEPAKTMDDMTTGPSTITTVTTDDHAGTEA